MKRLQQVLLNLVSNAIKFTNREGKINIKVEKVIDQENNAPLLKISITDNGIGIREEDKPKLFKLFSFVQQTDN